MGTLDVFESVRLVCLEGLSLLKFSFLIAFEPSALRSTLLHCAIYSFLFRISSCSRFSYPKSSMPLVMNVLFLGGFTSSILSIRFPPLYFTNLWSLTRFKHLNKLLWWASLCAFSRFLVAYRYLTDHSLNRLSAVLLSLLNSGFRFRADVGSRASFWAIDLYSLTLIFTLFRKIMFY